MKIVVNGLFEGDVKINHCLLIRVVTHKPPVVLLT